MESIKPENPCYLSEDRPRNISADVPSALNISLKMSWVGILIVVIFFVTGKVTHTSLFFEIGIPIGGCLIIGSCFLVIILSYHA